MGWTNKIVYQQLASIFLTVLCISSILLLIQIHLPSFSIFWILSIFFGAIIAVNKSVKIILHNRHTEVFDLTSPLSFETGFLLFKSNSKRLGIFFAFALSTNTYDLELARRTVTILLKIIPASSIFSIEWDQKGVLYTTFFIKVDKTDIVDLASELMNNIQASFQSVFGRNNTKLLDDKELVQHLALGIKEHIQKVAICDKHSVSLQTENAQLSFSIIQLTNYQTAEISSILPLFEDFSLCKLLFTLRREEADSTSVSPLTLLVSTMEKGKLNLPEQLPESISIQQVPASQILFKLGDILTRNLVVFKSSEISFEFAAEKMIEFMLACLPPSQTSQSRSIESLETVEPRL